jgi:TetR/AcrR family transcriptional regulator
VTRAGKKLRKGNGKARREGALPTRERILRAAIMEFSKQGYRGGRVERIGKDSRVNLRMIYHYFGGKEGLYVATLERVYVEMRRAEQQLELTALAPLEAMRRFIDFTFDHLAGHPEFIGLTLSENQHGARYLRRSELVSSLTPPLLAVIRDILERGRKDGVFRGDVDAVQLFVTLHSLCYLHLSHKSTLSVILHSDLADQEWIAARRRHVEDVLFSYLRPKPAAAGSRKKALPAGHDKLADRAA